MPGARMREHAGSRRLGRESRTSVPTSCEPVESRLQSADCPGIEVPCGAWSNVWSTHSPILQPRSRLTFVTNRSAGYRVSGENADDERDGRIDREEDPIHASL